MVSSAARSSHAQFLSAAVIPLALAIPRAQQLNPSVFADLRWRSIGPPRSGYVSAPSGVACLPCLIHC